MGKKSKRRQQSGGGTASNNNTTREEDDAFLEAAMERAAAEKKVIDDAAVKQAAEDVHPLDGLEGFDRFQAVCNSLGVQTTTIQQQRRPSPPPSKSSSAWSHLSMPDAHLMMQWERSMDSKMRRPNRSASETMKAMAITPEVVKGIPVGHWFLLVSRMELVGKPMKFPNSPPLRAGDYIEIVPGNDIKWGLVGQRGTIVDYYGDDDKWGIEMDSPAFGPSLVHAGNLKRIRAGNGFAPQQKWTRRQV